MENVYQMFGEAVQGQKKQGLVPVLYLQDASPKQYGLVMRFVVPNGTNPKDLVFVPVRKIPGIKNFSADKISYVFFAKDEKQALEVFRRRVAYVNVLRRCTCTGAIPKLSGIDAQGEIRADTYIPAFNIKGIKSEDIDEIIAFADSKVASFSRGVVEGRIKDTGSAEIMFYLRDELACAKDIWYIRERLLNSVCMGVEKQFACEVERLDDRGGTNEDNICTYLTDANKREFLAQSVLTECTAITREVSLDEQQTQD